MEITVNLHPAGDECAPGSLDCGVFGISYYGMRSSDHSFVTFAVGTGKYTGVMIYVEGLLSEDEFRQAGTYKVALLNKQPPCLHKEVLTTTLYYKFDEVDRGPMPLTGTQLPSGEVTYINMMDALGH